jgi:BirA family biotin operon repressor/biotin-[acetyl-CoA-carboxylase] ligase
MRLLKIKTEQIALLNLCKNTISLSASTINNHLGIPFIELLSIDSTNNYAMEQLRKNSAAHGTVYFAHEQFKGKGQRTKQWHSKQGENIILSAVLNTSFLYVSHQFFLSMTIALATYDFFKFYASKNVSIKWPNDLYWCDRKAGGILIENIISGNDWQWAVAGIGININQTIFNDSVTNAVSLKQITGKSYQPVALAKELCEHIEKRYRQLLNNETALLLHEYNSVLYKQGQLIKLKKGNVVFEALIRKVNENGQLLINAGTEQTYNVGEIEWIVNQ